MYIPGDERKWTARAPAKLNMYLAVGERRGDGFHDLETLIVPIRIWDTLTLTAIRPPANGQAGSILLAVRTCGSSRRPCPISVPPSDENLVDRALKLLQQQSGCRYGAEVELVKRIPSAAGLGGGSSDAAAALRWANRAWKLDWPLDRLSTLASELGSDVPFFLSSGPAVCRGRGEQVQRLAGLPPFDVVVVKPPVELKTSDVYQAHDALDDGQVTQLARAGYAAMTMSSRARSGRWGDLRHWMWNGLQAAAASLTPWVAEISAIFDRLDFVAHQLSGSGSAYFGVCRHAQHARRLANILRTRQLGLVYATRSCQ